MKNKFLKIGMATVLLAAVSLNSCKEDFIAGKPDGGTLNESVLSTSNGVNALLIGAYSMVDGQGAGQSWAAAASNWVYGSICGGDAHKGTDAGDQPDINPIARYEQSATNGYFNDKWKAVYEGVSRSNSVLNVLKNVKDASDADKKNIEAQARFLRGYYHFELKRIFNNIPYITESSGPLVANDKDTWPLIEADLKYAYDNLPETQGAVGRVNKWAAGAYLAKAMIYQKKYSDALPIFTAVVNNGKTSDGKKYALNPAYVTNFDAATDNSAESVFSVQNSVNDGGGAGNANAGDVLNFPYNGGPGGCCGFFQPSQEFVNSFRTSDDGLPLLDGSYNKNPVKNDQGLSSKDPFTPDAGNLDPRLDWSVGRRSIPYLDWGAHPGRDWMRDQNYGGPYSPKKNVYRKSQQGSFTDNSSWTSGYTANNVNLMRFADVLLMAAECEVEAGSLEKAREYVNIVRKRAANSDGFVKNADGTNAAKYVIKEYSTAWTSKDAARTAVRFERKIELGMEGHRFFDLVRWGTAATDLNAYLTYESTLRSFLAGAKFTAGKNEYFPIPLRQIDLSNSGGKVILKQNPGY